MQNLVILGSPRSGTTFLASLLKPTEYGCPFETQFIFKYHNKLDSYGDITELNSLTRLIGDISNERAIYQWGITFIPEDIKAALGEQFTYTDIVDYLCTELMETKGKLKWGDKTPHYILKLDQLAHLYPKAKYLYIVRGGRDVALSLLKKPWVPNNVYKCAEQWEEANNKEQQILLDKLEVQGNLLYIKYEKLLADTELECRKIYNFLGDDIEKNRKMVDELIAKTISGNSEKWKTQITEKEISVHEAVAKNTIALHQYEVISLSAKLSLIKVLVYKTHHLIKYGKYMFEMNVVDGIKIKFFGKQPFNE